MKYIYIYIYYTFHMHNCFFFFFTLTRHGYKDFLTLWLKMFVIIIIIFWNKPYTCSNSLKIDKIFLQIVCLHWLPNTIVSDWDAKFMRYFWKNLCRMLATNFKIFPSRQLIECWVHKNILHHLVNVIKED